MYTKVMTKINQVCKIRNPTEEFGFSILDWEILEFWIFDLDLDAYVSVLYLPAWNLDCAIVAKVSAPT